MKIPQILTLIRNLPLFRQREARMYINTHQEDVFVAIHLSGDMKKTAKF